MQQLLHILPGLPAGILGNQDGDQQREDATHYGIKAPGERAAGRGRKEHHEQRLQRQLGGEDVAAVQEASQQDGEQKYDGGLPDPGAQPVQQQVTHRNAYGAAQAHFQDPA